MLLMVGNELTIHQVDMLFGTLESYILNQPHKSLDHFRAVAAITITLLCIVNGEVVISILLKRLS